MDGKVLLGQYLILVMVLLGQLHGYESCIQKESKALLELKKYIISRSQEKFSNNILPSWTNDTKSDCCQWEGLDCNHTSGRVITLSIGRLFPKESSLLNLSLFHPFEEIQNLSLSSDGYNNQFNGFFDNIEGYESLRRLRNLKILDLSFNQFNNSILPFLDAATWLTTLSLQNNDIYGPAKVVCQMRKLRELNLRGNQFVGQLPFCLGSLNKLRVLDLSSNQFSGNLPSSFSSLESLEYLSLSDNNFTGLFTLHPLTNLTMLKVFKLSSSDMIQVEAESTWQPKFQLSVAVLRSCSLETIPSFLMYQKNLGLVDLSNNRLSGHIPTWLLENNQELEVLQLQNNSFTLFQMPTIVHNLQVLDISTNGIESFPDAIGRALPNMVYLNGSSNGFQGYFPSSIGEMKNLYFLDLSYNNFSGKLPGSFVMGCISLKYLKLSHNKFSGHFLSREPGFTSLSVLIINNNLFTGKIGDGLISSSGLFVLDMSNNFLTGPIPSWISKSSLQFLLLSNNLLQGTIPPSLLAVTYLDISGNLFSGPLPTPGDGITGHNLFLQNNNFTGPIPEALLDGVLILDLSNNKLSGSIPQFVNTQNISILLLRGNHLTGYIPREMCDLSNIKLLDLSNNKLNGSIPSCLYNLSLGRGGGGEEKTRNFRAYIVANLEWKFYKSTLVVENFRVDTFVTFQDIQVKFATKKRYDSYAGRSEFSDGILDYMYGMDLSNNELSGAIPKELGKMTRVRALNLSHNFLSSSIPSSFSSLKDIESLDLSYNKLQGRIPQQLTSLTFLVVFDVSHNNLSGIIPQGTQFNTFNENIYLGNPLLCGPPTNRSCDATKSSDDADNGREEEDDAGVVDMLVFYYRTASTYSAVLIGILLLMFFDCPWRTAWIRIIDAFIASAKTMFP